MVAEWEAKRLDVFFIETPLRMDMVGAIGELGKSLKEKGCATKVAYGERSGTLNAPSWRRFVAVYLL